MSKQRGIAFLAFLTIGLAADAGAASAYLTEDNSTDYLMDKATATRIWSENVPERVRKLFPPRARSRAASTTPRPASSRRGP